MRRGREGGRGSAPLDGVDDVFVEVGVVAHGRVVADGAPCGGCVEVRG